MSTKIKTNVAQRAFATEGCVTEYKEEEKHNSNSKTDVASALGGKKYFNLNKRIVDLCCITSFD